MPVDSLDYMISDSLLKTDKEMQNLTVSQESGTVTLVFKSADPVSSFSSLTEQEVEIEDIFILEEEEGSFESNSDLSFSNQFSPKSIEFEESELFKGFQANDFTAGEPLEGFESLHTEAEERANFTILRFEEADIDKVWEEIDKKYILYKFALNLALDALTNDQHIHPQEYIGEDGEEEIKNALKKKWWKKNCWNLYLDHKSDTEQTSRIDPESTHGKRVLLFFQGTFGKKTGFFEMLNHKASLERLQKVYGDNIFLFTYPTIKHDIKDNVLRILKMFKNCEFHHSKVDLVGTSRGCLVVRDLLVALKEGNHLSEANSYQNKLILVNGPNLGTPLAKSAIDFLKIVASTIPFPKGLILLVLKAFLIKKSLQLVKGITCQQPENNPYLNELNRKFNTLISDQHFFCGTESGKFLVNRFYREQPNDTVIPVASMMGELVDNFDNFNYGGEALAVKDTFWVGKSKGGQNHGNQYKNLALLQEILDRLDPQAS